ncbi:MAG TPA: carbohydrate porin, partial [Chthonomonadales bacterium]|nr:carbohydrate porin [Chthonomonadales bacterium]
AVRGYAPEQRLAGSRKTSRCRRLARTQWEMGAMRFCWTKIHTWVSLPLAVWFCVQPAFAQDLLQNEVGASARLQPSAAADCPEAPGSKRPLLPYELGFQVTFIDQQLFKFHSPYQGPHSLVSRNENELSDTYTLFAGVRVAPPVEIYVNPEMARGNGLSQSLGLAGITNGDVIRNPSLGMDPYLARYFARLTIPTGRGTEPVAAGENQIVEKRPTNRLVITSGKLATTDIFDLNSYANSTRTQFMNWALINNAAYDYAADTRGYSQGLAVEWIHPTWAIRAGAYKMPNAANGPHLSGDLIHNRGDQAEMELRLHALPRKSPLITRWLVYRNFGYMGSYREALQIAQATGEAPDITSAKHRGSVKYGAGLNFEQALGDDGATGIFGRFGWNDGATESFVFTEADRTISLGAQIAGSKWGRKTDRFALAIVQNDLSRLHKEYLAAGGLGFLLGDGRLNNGSERVIESYYTWQLGPSIGISLDGQYITNPGYNRDRGPVTVVSARVHWEM